MTQQVLQMRAKALFDYLVEVVKLGLRVTRTVDEHDDFLLFQHELPDAEGITLSTTPDDKSWLTISRQEIPKPPDLPDDLKEWCEVSVDHDKEPHVIEQRRIDGGNVGFYDDEPRQDAFIKYIDIWEHWAAEARPKKKVQSLFTKLFQVGERLKYDEQLELIWGYGMVLWQYSGYTIKYPVITRQMFVGHDPVDGIIRVLPNEDEEQELEFGTLADLNLPDLSDVKKQFREKETEYSPVSKESYLDILKAIAGRLAPDGQLISPSEIQTITPTNTLRIVDCWVLFLRKRQQDAIIRDIEALRDKLKENEIALPGGFSSFLGDPDESHDNRSQHPLHDEWSALLDKQVLFPLPANQEQIQIIDRIERADGVVVWGPPGTGKSHTIANLLCHFMAEGKRVLVTTQKDQALVVLQDMIPKDLRPLCISVLSNVRDGRERLKEAVTSITGIVTQSQPFMLRKEIEGIESKIDRYCEELETVRKKIEGLARTQYRPVRDKDGELLLPTEFSQKMQKEEEQHAFMQGTFPHYEVRLDESQGQEAVQIITKPPLSEEEMEQLKDLRAQLLECVDDFSYELPPIADLPNEKSFGEMTKDLQKISQLEDHIGQLMPGLIFIDEGDEAIAQALGALGQALEALRTIREEWQHSLLEKIRANSQEAERTNKAVANLDNCTYKVKEAYQKKDPSKCIILSNVTTLEDLQRFVLQVVTRVKNGKKPWGFLDFDNKKKQALQAIRINDKTPTSGEDWETVLGYIGLLLAVKDLRCTCNSFAKNIGVAGIDPEEVATEQGIRDVLSFVEKLKGPVTYEMICLPRVRETLGKVIADVENQVGDKSLEKLFRVLSDKRNQQHFHSSKAQIDHLRNRLQQTISRGRCHPVVLEMMNCMKEDFYKCDDIVARWATTYQKAKRLEDLRPSYDRFSQLLDQLRKHAPSWAVNWTKTDILETKLCPSYWQESWQFHAQKRYLDDISNNAQKIRELENKQDKSVEDLKRYKEKLVLAKTKLGLLSNTSDTHRQALERWSLAVRKLGRGTGKWAWMREKLVQQEMSQAKNAVPVWIMPLYKVSETIPSEFGTFDAVIIDEASQCDVRAFLAVARGKKIIVVGDPEQISPDAVGIPEAGVQRLIKEHLSGIPGGHHFDLKTGFYDIAKITFTGQGTLMLREHFRCVPEIIQFSNQLCYQGRIIPLRNPPPTQRLEPVLQSVFIEGGYRESRQDINKPEARAICEKLKQMIGNPRYKGRTFGVISLTGYDQAKYIFNIINDYLTPEQQDAGKFRVGDAYAFQGDERDVMLLSMVVGSNDEKRSRSLTGDVYRQRFNVAVSRARDQLILFHSVRLVTDLTNPEDLRYRLLDFVQNPIPPPPGGEELRTLCESDFERAVYDWLTKGGYRVSPQVRVGAKRIDLVVEGVNNARLAVECDGDKWHPPERWWEDQVRERQLRRAGKWIFCHIWGSAFYRDPDSAMEPVLSKLTELEIQPRKYSSI